MHESYDYFDSAEAMAAVVVLKQFGLDAYATGRESDSGQGEAPLMVWTVYARTRTYPEPHEDDYGESHFDRELEERLYGPRNRIYRRDLYE